MNSKIYRCGYCGCPTDSNGHEMPSEIFRRVVNIIERIGDAHTHLTHGDCCMNDSSVKNQVQITRDMAIDAGDRSLEGKWINWV